MPIIDRFLEEVVLKKGSDLHFVTGSKPMIRINGNLTPIRDDEIPVEEGRAILYEILSKVNRSRFEDDFDVDFAYQVQGVSRFRVAMFHQSRGVGAVFRVIPDQSIPIEALGLPV
ncbi:MAG TPA: type IV pili twitching motility protein PilT, partial [bacterium]|nr:type IV pili twitching motility protein PilT [bacterium]